MNRTIDAPSLARQLAATPAVALLDVLLPEHYQAYHIPGALNACVYEVAFLDTVHALFPDKSRPIVLYDTSRRSQAAGTALKKLHDDGYLDLCLLADGLEGWQGAGLPVEPAGAACPEEPRLADRSYRVDTGKSLVTWIGRNLGGRHSGSLALLEGEVTISGGELTGGRIVVDVRSLTNQDLQQQDYREMLINHLLSEDFLEASRYPTAEAVLRSWRPVPGAFPGQPNYQVEADLTIKGVTRPVQFAAAVAPQEECLKAQASLNLDRTQWNINYGSGRLFEKLGMHLVHDMITLEVFLVLE
jgi:polyisoprenoid-binding protein YceI/rhodanese-related sulfurtransferase